MASRLALCAVTVVKHLAAMIVLAGGANLGLVLVQVAREFGVFTGVDPNNLTLATVAVLLLGLAGLAAGYWLVRRCIRPNYPPWVDQ